MKEFRIIKDVLFGNTGFKVSLDGVLEIANRGNCFSVVLVDYDDNVQNSEQFDSLDVAIQFFLDIRKKQQLGYDFQDQRASSWSGNE